MKKNYQNSFLFPKTFKNTGHLQFKAEYWAAASDDDHLEAMNIPVHRVNEHWVQYLQKHRPHLIKKHLENCKARRF